MSESANAGPYPEQVEQAQALEHSQEGPSDSVEETSTGPESVQVTPSPEAVEDHFFDFNAIKDNPELVAAYKQMQAAYTRKTQALASSEAAQAVQLVKRFQQDPHGMLQSVAADFGFTLTKRQAEQIVQQGKRDIEDGWTPSSWDEVMQVAEQRVLEKIRPDLGKVRELEVKTQAEKLSKSLDSIDPQWRLYEDEIADTLRKYPAMAGEAEMLYRASVPSHLQARKAAKQALDKIQSKVSASRVSGASGVRKSEPAPQDITKMDPKDAFQAAVAHARLKLQGG